MKISHATRAPRSRVRGGVQTILSDRALAASVSSREGVRRIQQLLESGQAAKDVEVDIVPRLRTHIRADRHRSLEAGKGPVGLSTSGAHGGEQVQRKVVVGGFGQHSTRQPLGRCVVAIVQRGGGQRETLLDRLGGGWATLLFALAEAQVHANPIK
ncbi:MAG: hypothetical protein ABI051_11800 [Vicinamibacterales bacterium]